MVASPFAVGYYADVFSSPESCQTSDGTIHAITVNRYYHSHDNGVTWDAGVVLGTSVTGTQSSIACDSSDNLHFCYTATGSTSGYYKKGTVNKSGSPWTWTLGGADVAIDTTGGRHWDAQCLVDSVDTVHAIYYVDTTTGHWLHSHDGGSTWSTAVNGIAGASNATIRPCVDSANNIYFAAQIAGGAATIRKATYTAGSPPTWAIGSPTTVAAASNKMSIRCLPDDRLVVTYGATTSTSYVRRSTNVRDITAWDTTYQLESSGTGVQGVWTVVYDTASRWRVYYPSTALHASYDIFYKETNDSGASFGSRVAVTNDTKTNAAVHESQKRYGSNYHLIYRSYPSSVYQHNYIMLRFGATIDKTSDANFLNITKIKTILSDSRFKSTTTDTILSDSVFQPIPKTILSDTRFKSTTTDTVLSDSRYFKPSNTKTILSASRYFKPSNTNTLLSDSVIQPLPKTILSNTRFFKPDNILTILSDSKVQPPPIEVLSDSRFFKPDNIITILSNNIIQPLPINILSNSRYFKSDNTLTLLSDAIIQPLPINISSDARFFKSDNVLTITSDSVFQPLPKTIISDSIFFKPDNIIDVLSDAKFIKTNIDITSDAKFIRIISIDLLSDTIFFGTYSLYETSDVRLFKPDNILTILSDVHINPVPVDIYIQSDSRFFTPSNDIFILSDAVIQPLPIDIQSDSRYFKPDNVLTITSDAIIQPLPIDLLSDSIYFKPDNVITVSSDSVIQPLPIDLTSDSRFKLTITDTVLSDSVFQPLSKTILSDTRFFKPSNINTLLSDSVFQPLPIDLLSDSRYYKLGNIITVLSDAYFIRYGVMTKISDSRFINTYPVYKLSDAHFNPVPVDKTKISDAKFIHLPVGDTLPATNIGDDI